MEPFFSIVLPTYNRRHQLERCLASIKKQDFEDYEIIVVDDGSTDDTQAFLASGHPDVRSFYQSNHGVSKARNTGMLNAKGTYIAFMDSDDLWYPSRLKILHAVVSALPAEVGLIFNDMDRIVAGNGDRVSYSDRYFGTKRRRVLEIMHRSVTVPLPESSLTVPYDLIFAQLLHGNIIHPACTVMRRALVTEVGQFREDFRVANDSEYFLRVSKDQLVAYVPMILTSIDPPRSDISLSAPSSSKEKINNMILAIESYYQKEAQPGLKAQLQRRLANLHALLGYHHLSEYNGVMSRRHYTHALKLNRQNIRFLAMILVTLLPLKLLKLAAAIKRNLRDQ